ncbi:MAG: urease accessory protein UreD [Leptolyngbya sp.]|nr:urease accessory protein UreD [Leptolyngbya sp.]
MVSQIESAEPATGQGWHGKADLVYDQRDGKTVPTRSFTQAPLKVQRPLYPEGPKVCHSVIVHTAGGMVGGDQLTTTTHTHPHSHALITTAAANKIYGTGGGLGAAVAAGPGDTPKILALAEQTVTLSLDPGSSLEWFPQDTIVFSGAQYRQRVRVNLAEGSVWCGWDVTRFGRSAGGERFTQGHWRADLEVWQGDGPLWVDRQQVAGGSAALDSPNGLAGQAVVGSLAVVGWMPSPGQVTLLRELWPSDQPGDIGVSRLQKGVVCRYRGPSSEAAHRWFVAVWQLLRPHYLDRPATVSRLWAR